jgi:hypothetical protein
MYYYSFLENSNNIVDVSFKLLVLDYQQKTKTNNNSFFMIRKVMNKARFIVFTLQQNIEKFTNCFFSQKYKTQR